LAEASPSSTVVNFLVAFAGE